MAVKQKQTPKRQKSVKEVKRRSMSFDENLNHDEKQVEGISSDISTPNKYQLPSSMIALTEQEEAELRDVIMQMTLRDCGL